MYYFWLNSLPNQLKLLLISATVTIGSIANQPAQAQITPDESLGEESSVVTPDVEVKGESADRIDGGAIRDRHLFHSFSEFNVGESQRVYFANPDNIEQIFTRVTGSNPSNINGTLGVDGAADLLLLNPNGIIFGENSSLDVEGSFFGTTADSVLFEDDTEFSATEPNSSLLTVSVPLGLQVGNNPGAIEVRSPLELAEGQNFSLVGGKVNLEISNINSDDRDGLNIPSGGIKTLRGRIELGGLSTSGIVTFKNNSNLNFPQKTPRADVTLKNFFTNGQGGEASIAIYSQNLKLTNSGIATGIESDFKPAEDRVGDIIIDTSEATIIEADKDSTSAIFSSTGDVGGINTTVNAGNISITTGNLSITGTSFIFSLTTGAGDAGSINIDATKYVSLSSEPTQRNDIASLSFATGNGADIQIKTPQLFLKNADISTSTGGAGNAGDIALDVADSIFVSNGEIKALTIGSGNAGNINFESETANITFEEQASVRTNVAEGEVNLSADSFSSIGTGKGGNIIIEGRNFSATNSVVISTATEGEATNDKLPNAGNLKLNISNSITIDNNSVLETASASQGNAGQLTISTDRLIVRNSAISTGTYGLGQAGNINIIAFESIDLKGSLVDFNEISNVVLPSSIFSSTFGDAKAGNIAVKTKNLTLNRGAQIQATTSGTGNAGNINIDADKVKLTGISEENFPSAILAITDASGDGGTVNIKTNDLVIQDRAGIGVTSIGEGNAGAIFASINDSLKLDNGAISSFSDRSSGGEISIDAGSISLKADSDIRTNVENGAGGGGNITLSADSIVAFDDSDVFANSADGRGGNITLDTDAFFASPFNSALINSNPQFLEDNNRVDLSATGSVNGIIDLPEVNFLPNNLVKLSEETIDSEEVVANSCVVRSGQPGGTFVVTGSGGLPMRPADAGVSDYATGTVRAIPEKKVLGADGGRLESVAEPEGVYRLANGKLVLSRECR